MSAEPLKGVLIVLCGPSGVGKSTLSRRLSERLQVKYTVSVTTRPERPNEAGGKDYDYVSEIEFFRMLEADEFLEYAHVHGHYYATPKHPALDELSAGQDVLLEIDVQGALQVRYHYREAMTVFILPPDEQTLLDRLRGRGRDTDAEISKRFRAAKREIAMAKGSRAFDYMVINDELDRATDELIKIVKHKRSGGFD